MINGFKRSVLESHLDVMLQLGDQRQDSLDRQPPHRLLDQLFVCPIENRVENFSVLVVQALKQELEHRVGSGWGRFAVALARQQTQSVKDRDVISFRGPKYSLDCRTPMHSRAADLNETSEDLKAAACHRNSLLWVGSQENFRH